MRTYRLHHDARERTIHCGDVPEAVLAHLSARGFGFVSKEDGAHLPEWILELVRIQERRGHAGSTIDWDKVWNVLHEDAALRMSVHAHVDAALKDHGLTREHADDIVVDCLRAVTKGEKLPAIDYRAMKKNHEDELEKARELQHQMTKHHMQLVAEQVAEAAEEKARKASAPVGAHVIDVPKHTPPIVVVLLTLIVVLAFAIALLLVKRG